MNRNLRIVLVPNQDRDVGLDVTASIAACLAKAGGEIRCTESLPEIPRCTPEEGAEWADVAVVLGGDGTILRFAHSAALHDLPILGINCGSLGYMAELNSEDLDQLTRLFCNDFRVEERMMLTVSVCRNGEEVCRADCLNDGVVSYGTLPHLVHFELFDRGQAFAVYNADGMIFATPTGSTAYSLSAGGPIVDPSLKAIVATPVCAHCLSARPTVFSADTELSLRIKNQRKGEAYLSFDGERNFLLQEEDEIFISKSPLITRLIRFNNATFGTVVSAKLKHN